MHNIYNERQLRHKQLIKLIAEKKVTRQEEIVTRLRSAGFNVTQASVSRDLEFLNIRKRSGNYILDRSSVEGLTPTEIEFANAGENLIVIKCRPGHASALAILIDEATIDGIVGTIAGDDTIFVAVVSQQIEGINEELGKILKG